MFHYFLSIFKRVLSLSKKVFIVIFVFGLIIGLFSHFIQKDKPQLQYNLVAESRKDIYKKLNDPELNKSLPTRLSLKTFRFMSCIMAGEACTNNPEDGDKNFKNSLFGKASQLMALPYMNPPASGTYWVMNTFQNAGFIPNTYAAEGIGFASIKPLMNLWKVFRDVTYMLMVLFLVAIGFMIMFRVKINPQTVISVENSLPKIAVSMILVTFSFAIAGFLIDLMYILITLVISILSDNNAYYVASDMQKSFITANFSKLFSALMGNPLGFAQWGVPVVNAIPGFFDGLSFLYFFGRQFMNFLGTGLSLMLDVIIAIAFGFIVAPKINENLGIKHIIDALRNISVAGFSLGSIPEVLKVSLSGLAIMLGYTIGAGLIAPLLIGLLFLTTILFVWARIFMLLLNAYIQVLLHVIFAPFLISLELLPGSKMGFSQWFKNLLGELITFVVVVAIFCVSNVLLITIQQTAINAGPFVQPNLFSPPFLFAIDPKALGMLVSVGLSLAIPDFVKTVKEAVGAKGLGVSFGIGTYFAGLGTATGGAMGLVGTYSSLAMAFPQLREWIGKRKGLGFMGNATTGQPSTSGHGGAK